MYTIEEKLGEILDKSKSAPILFIGSGFSRRYLGTEEWSKLLEYFCKNLDYDYEKYFGEANGDLPKVATLIANDFYEVWWKKEEYKKSRLQFSKMIKNKKSPLKFEIAEYLKSKQENNEYEEEIKLLKEISEKGCIDSVITTNWDNFLEEKIFTSYDVKVGQDDLLTADLVGLEEIYKIHGSITIPESLVLDSEDYENFNSKNAYLSSKLLTLFIEHPIIFIGYSLTDENIQGIIKSIAKCLPIKASKKLENNLISVQPIFDMREDSIERDILTIDNIAIPRTIISLKDYSKLYNALLKYKRKFPVKLVKKMRESIYEIIIENNPKNQIIATDIKNCESIDGADFVVGVGIKKKLESVGVDFEGRAFNGIEYDDLLRDIIIDDIVKADDKEKAKRIINEKIKKNYPKFKYIKIAGDIKLKETIKKESEKSFSQHFVQTNNTYKAYAKKTKSFRNATDIINNNNLNDYEKVKLLVHLDENKFDDLENLKVYLTNNVIDKLNKKTQNISEMRKIIKIYDFLKYNKVKKK